MEDYFAAKALLFSPDYLQKRAIINSDDAYGKRIIASLHQEQVWSYSVNDHTADFWMSDLSYQPNGVSGILHTPNGNVDFNSPLVGQFNLENLLAAVGAVIHLGLDLQLVADAIPSFPGVPGRMERVQINSQQDISVIVDYAHTPDSLENVLKASRPFISGRMICVFGCGGDRDRTKRPLMGKIAAELADLAIVTFEAQENYPIAPLGNSDDVKRLAEITIAGFPSIFGNKGKDRTSWRRICFNLFIIQNREHTCTAR
jgi:UDP-N-acetylmuramoyl-L-alanyl-D-glutamate--2,6-diaminopimelate ligase